MPIPKAPDLFDASDPEDRARLIAVLQERGLAAYETSSGGGTMHAAITLHEQGDNILQVVTGEGLDELLLCAIGLMGYRDGKQVGSTFLVPISTLADAESFFVSFQLASTHWVARYFRGDFDL